MEALQRPLPLREVQEIVMLAQMWRREIQKRSLHPLHYK
jgi:hypothetical protein